MDRDPDDFYVLLSNQVRRIRALTQVMCRYNCRFHILSIIYNEFQKKVLYVAFTYFQPFTMNFRKKSYTLPSLLQERGEKYLYLCIYFIHKTCLFSFSSTLVIFSLTTDSGYWKHYMRIQNYDSKQHPVPI